LKISTEREASPELAITKWVNNMGINGYLKFVKDACKGDVLNYNRIADCRTALYNRAK
jgi:hypothetical protein